MRAPTPILCRDSALHQLHDALTGARKGAGSSLLFTGENGIGRSRMLIEAAEAARAERMIVLSGRASGVSPTTPFRPLSEALLAYTRSDGGAAAAESLGPYRVILGRLIPEWNQHTGVTPDQPLIVLAEGVLRLLSRAGAGRGCLLVLDDLHHADPETLAIVEYLVDHLADQPVVLVATALDQECAALDLARSAARRGALGLVRLTRLRRDGLPALVGALLECAPAQLPDDLVQAVWQLSDGSPLLVEELLIDLVDGGLLSAGPDGWRLAGRLDAYVPVSLSRRLARRLELSPPGERGVLLAAAVFGERFPLAALRIMTGRDEQDLARELQHGLAAELVRADGENPAPDWYVFRHPLTAGALLESSASSYRAELARAAADAVEELDPGLAGVLCQLVAGLRLVAGEPGPAGRRLAEAGRRALADGAAASAVDLLEQASGLVTGDPVLHADVCESLVQALVEVGKIDRALQMTAEPDALGGAWSGRRLAALHTRLAWAAVFAARTADGLAQIAAARRHLGPGADPADSAAVDVVAAHLIVDLPGPDQFRLAEAMARRAAEVAEQHRLPVVACQAWQLLGQLLRQRDLDEATFCLERSRRIAVEHGLRIWEMHALVRLGNDDAARDGSLRRLRQVSRDAGAAGAVTAAYQAEASLALQVALQGGYAEATRIIDRTLPATTRLELVETAGHLWQTRAVVAAHQGQQREMERVITELRRRHTDSSWADAKVFGLARAFCSLLAENRARALTELGTALRADGGNPALSPLTGRVGLHLLLRALDGDTAEDEAADEYGAYSVRQLRWNWQFAEFARAVRAGRCGDHAVARAAAASALEAAELYPMARHLGMRLVAEAALADGWGDPVSWLRTAEQFFHDAGIGAVASACRSLLRRAGIVVGQRRDGTRSIPPRLRELGITAREYEILGLITVRMGNREIADRLHLSPRTVEKHVARLIAKTGRTDRLSMRDLLLEIQGE